MDKEKILIAAIDSLLENVDARMLSKTMTIVFIDYIRAQREGMPTDIYGTLNNVESIFELLYIIERYNAK